MRTQAYERFVDRIHLQHEFGPAPHITVPASALNYGFLGSIIAHEITHGFDAKGKAIQRRYFIGSRYDAEGRLVDWWKEATWKEFQNRTKCLIDQYGDITVPETKAKLDGELTLNENLADNGGLKQAYKVRLPGLEKFTNEQLFFLSYAQHECVVVYPAVWPSLMGSDHAPNRYRVNVPLSNLPEFAQAFSCPKNSPMNPEKRCIVI